MADKLILFTSKYGFFKLHVILHQAVVVVMSINDEDVRNELLECCNWINTSMP